MSIYYCNKENNICPKRESCKRYINSEKQCHTTLFKTACTEDNKYILFIKADEQEEGES